MKSLELPTHTLPPSMLATPPTERTSSLIDCLLQPDQIRDGLLSSEELNHGCVESTTSIYQTYFIRGDDGRRIAFEISGRDEDFPIVLLHGNPGSRLGPKPDLFFLHEYNIRLIAVDLPGYGFTDPLPGGNPADTVADIAAVIRYLGVERCGIIGRSGGGPVALACMAQLPAVLRGAVFVSPGPVQHMGASWFDGMTEHNRELFEAAFQDPPDVAFVTRRIGELATGLRQRYALSHIKDVLAPLYANIPHSLQLAIGRSQMAGLRFGIEGWVNALLGQRDWGFDPRATQPGPPKKKLVWYSGDDVFTPKQHGAWLAAHIPGAEVCYVPTANHFDAVEAVKQGMIWASSPYK